MRGERCKNVKVTAVHMKFSDDPSEILRHRQLKAINYHLVGHFSLKRYQIS